MMIMMIRTTNNNTIYNTITTTTNSCTDQKHNVLKSESAVIWKLLKQKFKFYTTEGRTWASVPCKIRDQRLVQRCKPGACVGLSSIPSVPPEWRERKANCCPPQPGQYFLTLEPMRHRQNWATKVKQS